MRARVAMTFAFVVFAARVEAMQAQATAAPPAAASNPTPAQSNTTTTTTSTTTAGAGSAPTPSQSGTTTTTTSTTTMEAADKRAESRIPYTSQELLAFGVVGALFAIAWAALGIVGLIERWWEFKASEDERLLKATIDMATSMTELAKTMDAQGTSPSASMNMRALVISVLRSIASFLETRQKP